MSTELEIPQFICGNCKEKMTSVLDKDHYYCWDCRSDKIEYLIDENTVDFELHECDDCGTEYVKTKPEREVFYYNIEDKYEFPDLCDICEQVEIAKQRKIRKDKEIAKARSLAENRKNEVFPNKYVVPITKVDFEWQSSRRERVLTKTKYYKFRCGDMVEVSKFDAKSATQWHVFENNCLACKVLAGDSRAKKMNQDNVMKLFKQGMDGFQTPNSRDSEQTNYKSENGVLTHYWTTEALRTNEDKIIANVQCWATGFAKCSISGADYALPLSTLEGIYEEYELKRIEVLDRNEKLRATLFKIKDHYLVYGIDLIDSSRYLVQVPDRPQTVFQALEALKPQTVKVAETFQRQGDIFFVPVGVDVGEPDTYTSTWYRIIPDTYHIEEKLADFVIKTRNLETEKENTWYKSDKVSEYLRSLPIVERYTILLEYAKANKRSVLEKEVRNTQIMETNHHAEFVKVFDDRIYVKGKITHGREQHSRFVLDKWHFVAKNLALQSWQVEERGHGGGGD